MEIRINSANPALAFKRRLTPREEREYSAVLADAKNVCGNKGKSILIVPSTSLPNETGVGNLGTQKSEEFFDFAKKYWGINEIQLLPCGQFHSNGGEYPMYSGTSMDLGTQMIDIKSYATKEEYQSILDANKVKDRVNFPNIVDIDSPQEKVLKQIFTRMNPSQKEKFEKFKTKNADWLEGKALFTVLRDEYKTARYKCWDRIDANLFDTSIVSTEERDARIKEIYQKNCEQIDFYKFKQFLADESLKKAKEKLNAKGLKIHNDITCGFSYDEVWSHPKAFMKDCEIGWGFPALDLESKEGEDLLRQKIRLNAERFDGARIDASWTYVTPNIKNKANGGVDKKNYSNKFLDIIDEEFKKVKGEDFDLKNVMHEFAAKRKDFDPFTPSGNLVPFIQDREKIYTSQYLHDHWGSNDAYLKKGWRPEMFIIGAQNHDSHAIEEMDIQRKSLSRILNIPEEKLLDPKEFQKAKLAEPMGAYNNMVFFMNALGMDGFFKGNPEIGKNYNAQISQNFKEKYFEALQNGEGFNPMDALEKTFIARELDKDNPKLFKKIVKYRKILEEKGNSSKNTLALKIASGVVLACGIGFGFYKYLQKRGQNPHKT